MLDRGSVEPRRHHAVEHGELEVGVPLDGQLVVGDGVEDGLQLVDDARLVERLDAALVLRRDERGDRRERCRQRDLEPAVGGDLSVPLALGEALEGRHRRLGVAEVTEAHRVDRLAVADAQAGQGTVRAGTRRAHLELRSRAEHRVLPDDPVRPRPGLAVGDVVEAVAELGGHQSEHLVDAAQRDAADEQHTARRDAVSRVTHGSTVRRARPRVQALCSPPANSPSHSQDLRMVDMSRRRRCTVRQRVCLGETWAWGRDVGRQDWPTGRAHEAFTAGHRCCRHLGAGRMRGR